MDLTTSDWRAVLRQNFINWEKLAFFLELDSNHTQILKKSKFPLNLPLRLASKIEKGNLEDPILKQFLPTIEENQKHFNFIADPVGDLISQKSTKLLHKYQSRVLILASSACAMHCRFCFRQNFPYETVRKNFEEELKAIQNNTTISEVILSGGDPLSLDNDILGELLQRLSEIPHITRIRFHTRFPIGIPERIDESFLKIFLKNRCQIYFVIHCNHAKELDDEIASRLKMIQKTGASLLCQSVLLRGVNDHIDTLTELYEKLVNIGVIPYYLHQLDKVQGAHHFEVPEEIGKALITELCKRLPGYAVPTFVREKASEPSKLRL